MSAALQLPSIWATGTIIQQWRHVRRIAPLAHYEAELQPENDVSESIAGVRFAFYRKHTEKMLRRYLYASMQVGRAPSILGDPIDRGWVSSRPVRTFEDAVIFVLDIERCLEKLIARSTRPLLSRIVLQEYTHSEAATSLGKCTRQFPTNFHERSIGSRRSSWDRTC